MSAHASLRPRPVSARSAVFRAEALIASSAERVWDVLVDLPGYTDWNPWLRHAEGQVRVGGVVWVRVRLGEKDLRAKHIVLVVDRPDHLCWRDAGFSSLLVYGQRSRRLTEQPEGRVLLRQELMLEGPLCRLAVRMYGTSLQAGLEGETQALKRFVENRGRSQ
jgi:uncharacterized protein YndB with AHSA1/START domain